MTFIVITLIDSLNSFNLANNQSYLKYTLVSGTFTAEVYFNDTLSFIGTSNGSVYKKIITTNSTDFNITLQLLYQHSASVQGIFIDSNSSNVVSQDINLVIMGYSIASSSSITFNSSLSSKRLG